MTRTKELMALAEAANVFCNKCGYMGKDAPIHKRPSIGDECGYQAARMMWVRPEDIKQLVELVRLQHEALKNALGHIEYNGPDDKVGGHSCCYSLSYEPHEADCSVNNAIEAFNKWERK